MEEIILESGLKIGIEKKKAVVLGHTDPHLKVLSIPFEIEHEKQKITLVGIKPKAFSQSAIEEVSTPSMMTLIGELVFSNCENLLHFH